MEKDCFIQSFTNKKSDNVIHLKKNVLFKNGIDCNEHLPNASMAKLMFTVLIFKHG